MTIRTADQMRCLLIIAATIAAAVALGSAPTLLAAY